MSLHISSFFAIIAMAKEKGHHLHQIEFVNWQSYGSSPIFYTRCFKEILILILISTYTNLRSNTDPGLRVT